jgi:hypothetical protein
MTRYFWRFGVEDETGKHHRLPGKDPDVEFFIGTPEEADHEADLRAEIWKSETRLECQAIALERCGEVKGQNGGWE